MTTLRITVGDRDDVRESALSFVEAAESDELDDRELWATLQFGSYEDLVGSLTPLRLELLRAVATGAPESMREAARLVDRDVSDVHSDLKRLEVLGVLELEEGGPSGAIRPVVPYDRIEMQIDYPLAEELDATDGTASA
jgi:predicted transcriptional regulator